MHIVLTMLYSAVIKLWFTLIYTLVRSSKSTCNKVLKIKLYFFSQNFSYDLMHIIKYITFNT